MRSRWRKSHGRGHDVVAATDVENQERECRAGVPLDSATGARNADGVANSALECVDVRGAERRSQFESNASNQEIALDPADIREAKGSAAQFGPPARRDGRPRDPASTERVTHAPAPTMRRRRDERLFCVPLIIAAPRFRRTYACRA